MLPQQCVGDKNTSQSQYEAVCQWLHKCCFRKNTSAALTAFLLSANDLAAVFCLFMSWYWAFQFSQLQGFAKFLQHCLKSFLYGSRSLLRLWLCNVTHLYLILYLWSNILFITTKLSTRHSNALSLVLQNPVKSYSNLLNCKPHVNPYTYSGLRDKAGNILPLPLETTHWIGFIVK